MQILIEISTFAREVEIRKMTAYMKYKYKIRQLTTNYEREY